MIRVSDIIPPAAPPLAAPSARGADASRASSWFDEAAFGPATAIATELRAESRGLSAEQHASRVLAHLCGDGLERA